jgi:hypothetical protein
MSAGVWARTSTAFLASDEGAARPSMVSVVRGSYGFDFVREVASQMIVVTMSLGGFVEP